MKPCLQLHFYMLVLETVVLNMFITYFICAVSEGTVLSTRAKNWKLQPVCTDLAQKIDIYLHEIF